MIFSDGRFQPGAHAVDAAGEILQSGGKVGVGGGLRRWKWPRLPVVARQHEAHEDFDPLRAFTLFSFFNFLRGEWLYAGPWFTTGPVVWLRSAAGISFRG